jgi:hypothetical protein
MSTWNWDDVGWFNFKNLPTKFSGTRNKPGVAADGNMDLPHWLVITFMSFMKQGVALKEAI